MSCVGLNNRGKVSGVDFVGLNINDNKAVSVDSRLSRAKQCRQGEWCSGRIPGVDFAGLKVRDTINKHKA